MVPCFSDLVGLRVEEKATGQTKEVAVVEERADHQSYFECSRPVWSSPRTGSRLSHLSAISQSGIFGWWLEEPILLAFLVPLRTPAAFNSSSIEKNVKRKKCPVAKGGPSRLLTFGLTFRYRTQPDTAVPWWSEVFLCTVAFSMRLSELSRAMANSSINGRGQPIPWHISG